MLFVRVFRFEKYSTVKFLYHFLTVTHLTLDSFDTFYTLSFWQTKNWLQKNLNSPQLNISLSSKSFCSPLEVFSLYSNTIHPNMIHLEQKYSSLSKTILLSQKRVISILTIDYLNKNFGQIRIFLSSFAWNRFFINNIPWVSSAIFVTFTRLQIRHRKFKKKKYFRPKTLLSRFFLNIIRTYLVILVQLSEKNK